MPRPLDAILQPNTIAVVGASRAPDRIGHQIVANLLRHGFTGAIYPVNPAASAVHGVKAYPSLAELPDPIDLAVVVVPSDRVQTVAEEAVAVGVRGLVVISAGFRETGPDGAHREQALLDLVRSHGIRLVGPNCLGVINTDPAVSMNASFAPVMPPPGPIAFVSQSGAMGINILDYARDYQIGMAQFASVGNKADVSGNDLLLHWEHDAAVAAILMYVENFGNPRKFLEIASRVTKQKPIIALKAGRSKSGARAASSHTGALAASDVAVDALLAQAGVLRAASVEELFDMAMAFGTTTPPRSRRTAVLTNAGGPGILAADALESQGLEVVDLAPSTTAALAPLLPREASVRNPVDMIASAKPDVYREALRVVLDDPSVDAALAVFVPPFGVKQEAVADAIVDAVRDRPGKTVLAVLMGRDGLPRGRADLHAVGVPAYVFPESAARALGALTRYREWLDRPLTTVTRLDVDRDAAARIIAGARADRRARLLEPEALDLCAAYGINVAEARIARSPDEAARAATAIGFPVVMKVVTPDVVHKSDVGGVMLDLQDRDEARTAYSDIVHDLGRSAPTATMRGVLVQRMIRGGRETIVGVSRDPVFGPLVMFGLGGVYVEAIRDVVFRVAPIDDAQAREMIDGIRGSAILAGMRGRPGVHRDGIRTVLRRVSQLAADFPEIEEMDINPLLAFEHRVIAVDARVRLSATTAIPATARSAAAAERPTPQAHALVAASPSRESAE